jgi:hypothetical protein
MAKLNKPTADVLEKVVSAIRAGNHYETAAHYAGLDKTTFWDWMRRGAEPKPVKEFADFFAAVERARAASDVRDVLLIDQAAQSGSWQAAAWKLDRKQKLENLNQLDADASGLGAGKNKRALLSTLKELGINPEDSVRAQMCLTLADQLDNKSDPTISIATVAKELRLAIGELERSVSDFDNELGAFLADLSTPIRDSEEF